MVKGDNKLGITILNTTITIIIITMLTTMEQKLLIKILDLPITFKTQKIYKNRVSFYKAVWRMRNMDLIVCKDVDSMNGRKVKEWHVKPDGWICARILRKDGAKPLASS
jgi:hypothetical protein